MLINIFLITFFTCLVLTNISINFFYQQNIKQYVLKAAPKTHLSKEGTPTMGGLAIIISILIFAITQISSINYHLLCIIFLLVGFSLIGMIDDLRKIYAKKNKGLLAKQKFLLQIIVACVFVGLLAGGNHYESVTGLLSFIGPIPYYLLLVVIVVGASNAVNLTDGLDGLASGNLIIAFLGLLYFAFIQTNYNIMIIIISIIGSLFGFLWFNINPAKIFMGDTGSLSLGAVLAGLAIILHKEFILVLLGLIFVIETLSVMIQVTYFKLSHGKRIFKMTPIHHHFELSGWTENKVVLRFWIIGILALLLSIKFG